MLSNEELQCVRSHMIVGTALIRCAVRGCLIYLTRIVDFALFRWSYSILLWEITAYGDTPYPDFKVSDVSRLVGHLRSGGRPLRRQDTCNEEL